MIAETNEVLPDPTAPATPTNSPLGKGIYGQRILFVVDVPKRQTAIYE